MVSSAGISCPRAPNARDEKAGEPFGKEALFFTKELIMHREVGTCVKLNIVRLGSLLSE